MMQKSAFINPLGGILFILSLLVAMPAAPGNDQFSRERERMVRQTIEARGVNHEPTLKAMRTVPRHQLVPPHLRSQAYTDRPLPIGHGQTISQPYIVAIMTQLLELKEDDVVLEIGTGSGYQAAVLAEIVKQVYTIEIVEPLAKSAERDLRRLEYENIEVKAGDGYFGWAEKGPFDRIIVTAAAAHIPPPLLEQLKPGGRMVIPVGPPMQVQTLMTVARDEDGEVVQRSIMPVRFVPLTGGAR